MLSSSGRHALECYTAEHDYDEMGGWPCRFEYWKGMNLLSSYIGGGAQLRLDPLVFGFELDLIANMQAMMTSYQLKFGLLL